MTELRLLAAFADIFLKLFYEIMNGTPQFSVKLGVAWHKLLRAMSCALSKVILLVHKSH